MWGLCVPVKNRDLQAIYRDSRFAVFAFARACMLVPRTRISHDFSTGTVANFGFKSGTRFIELLVSFSIPKFAQRSLRMLANFGIGTLVRPVKRFFRRRHMKKPITGRSGTGAQCSLLYLSIYPMRTLRKDKPGLCSLFDSCPVDAAPRAFPAQALRTSSRLPATARRACGLNAGARGARGARAEADRPPGRPRRPACRRRRRSAA